MAGEETNKPVTTFGWDFEHKLKVKRLPALGIARDANKSRVGLADVALSQLAIILHGEFDPGSGRTLAVRLTHASRARTRPSGLGTAANG